MFTQTRTRRAMRRVIGAVDALAAPHGVDRYVEQLLPTWSSTEVRGRVADVDRSATGSTILTIEPNGNWPGFRAGQYTQLTVEIDGVRHTRCYSMASSAVRATEAGSAVRATEAGSAVRATEAGSARDDSFQLGIKAHPDGLVSQHLLAHAEPGMVVGLTPPAGDFHLPDARPDRLLLVSGGSGITPVASMLRTLCAEGHTRPVTFLHYATTAEAMFFREDIAALEAAHDNVTVLTAFDDGTGDLTGRLGESHLDAADPHWRDAEAYVCGPAPLMDAVSDLYDRVGAGHRVHREAFTLPAFVGEAGDVGGSVRFGASDFVIESDGRPLLEQAEANGLEPEHGCRMGICHTCTRSLTCGTVRDAVTGELTSDPGVDVRICVNVPVGDVEIDL